MNEVEFKHFLEEECERLIKWARLNIAYFHGRKGMAGYNQKKVRDYILELEEGSEELVHAEEALAHWSKDYEEAEKDIENWGSYLQKLEDRSEK
jgi:hypothetical protein